jgi:hypothetical protein
MRKAEELSMTTAPARTACGTKRRAVALPAENSAISVPVSACSVSSSTGSESPPYASLLQAGDQFGTDGAAGADDGNGRVTAGHDALLLVQWAGGTSAIKRKAPSVAGGAFQ